MGKLKHAGLGLMLLVVGLVAALPVASASATTISPEGTTLKITAGATEFKFGSISINCENGQLGEGPIPVTASSEVALSNPVFNGGAACSTVGLGGVPFNVVGNSSPGHIFRLSAISTTSGAWKLPGGNTNGLGLEFVSGSCHVSAKADAISGTWTNGTNGSPFATASTLNISNKSFNMHAITATEEANCPAALVTQVKKGSGIMTGTLTVTDTTLPTQAVAFH